MPATKSQVLTRRWATVSEAAEYMRLTTHAVREMITTGRITGYRGFGARQLTHNRTDMHVGSFAVKAAAEAAIIAKRNELFTHNDLDRGSLE